MFVNLLVGLPITAAVGLFLVGKFNLISVYFVVLFVGIGIDFSIQYSVRYRAERHDIPNLREAIRAAGHYVAAPLTLAGFATALGLLFVPADQLQGRLRTRRHRRLRHADRLCRPASPCCRR